MLLIATTHSCGYGRRSRDIVVRIQSEDGFRSRVHGYLYVASDRNVPLKKVMELIVELSHDFENFAILTPSVEQRLVNDRDL